MGINYKNIDMKEFKIKKSKFYKDLIASAVLIAVWSGVLLYYVITKNENEIAFIIFLVSLLFGITICLLGVYHTYCIISQYKYEQNVIFTIDKENKACIYRKGNKSIRFKFDDVKFVFSNSTCWGRIFRRSIGWYIEILLKSGKSIYLSSFFDVDDKYFTRVLQMDVIYQSASNKAFPHDELWMIGVKDNDLIDKRI